MKAERLRLIPFEVNSRKVIVIGKVWKVLDCVVKGEVPHLVIGFQGISKNLVLSL